LHPTQSIVGIAEVNCKIEQLNAMSHKEINDYARDHVVPVVLVTKTETYYILDHHHFAVALLFSEITATWLLMLPLLLIVQDLSAISYQ